MARLEDGYTYVPNWVVLHPDLTKTDLAVFIAIAVCADSNTHDCWPSYETLMRISGLSNRNCLAKHIKNLEDVGAISVIKPFTRHNPRRSNRYFIHDMPPGDYAVDADGFHLVGDRRFE